MAQVHKVVTLGLLSVCYPQYVFVGMGNSVVSQKELGSPQNGNNKLIQTAKECLDEACIGINDVDVFLALEGPGSLTGIRAGLSPIRAWGYSLNRPVKAFSSLETLAFGLARPALAIIPAKKGQYWVQSFVEGFNDTPEVVDDGMLKVLDKEGWTWVCPSELSPAKAVFIRQSPKPEQALAIAETMQGGPWMRALPKYLFEMTND